MRRAFVHTGLVCCLLAGWSAHAEPPEKNVDGVISEDSRWSSFTRIIYGRWASRAEVPPADPVVARQEFWRCTEDSWFIAYTALMEGETSPCGRLLRAAHPSEAYGGAGAAVRSKYRSQFARTLLKISYDSFHECANVALENGDTELLETCSHAMSARERAVAALGDDDRFGSWFGACRKVLLADAPATKPQRSGEELKIVHQEMTELEKTQARHCFRNLPSLYQVRWMNKLSDFWTPEELRALYLRSQQLGKGE